MSDCCNSFGGRITITAGDVVLTARGDITVMPSNRTVEGGSNQDGSDFYTVKPTQVGFDATFSNPCDFEIVELLRKCAVNVTITEEDHGRQHLFTRTRLVGEPRTNLSSGEVEGITGRGGKYRRVSV